MAVIAPDEQRGQMFCPRCGVSWESGQTTCSNCDAPLPLPASENGATADTVLTIVEQTGAVAAQPHQWDAAWVANERRAEPTIDPTPTPTPTGIAVTKLEEPSTALNAIALLAVLGGSLAIVSTFFTQLTISSDAPIAEVLGDYKLNDLAAAFRSGGLFTGSNLQVGVIVAGAFMVLGALFAAWGRSYGAGLATGAALALIPVLICVWGNVAKIADTAALQAQDAKDATKVGTYVDTSVGSGFLLLVGASVLGLVVLIVSVPTARSDHKPPFNPILSTVGLVASLVAAAGQLVPENGTPFSSNFSSESIGVLSLSGHLAIIGVVALCGVVGFACRNRWGLALAAGGACIYVWQWLSSIANLGGFPAEPAFGRPGNIDLKPHLATTIGLITMLLIGASTLALTTQNRDSAQ